MESFDPTKPMTGGQMNIGGDPSKEMKISTTPEDHTNWPTPATQDDRVTGGGGSATGSIAGGSSNIGNSNFGMMAPPSISGSGDGTMTVTGAGPVSAPQGQATSYTAQTVNGSKDVTAGTATAAPTAVHQSNVNFDTDTVEGRTNSIIAKDSPLMQRAAQLARSEMNRSGMMNSSVGMAAVQGAVMDRATQIAAADAAEYSATRRTNQAALNTAALQDAALMTDVSKFNVQSALQAGIINKQQADQIAQFNASMVNDASKFAALSAQDMQKFNIEQLLKAGIVNQEQANLMARFNASEFNAMLRSREQNQTSLATASISANAQMAAAQLNAETSRMNAQLQADTSRFTAELNAETSRYNSDKNYQSQMDARGWELANNILQNTEFTPEYKSQLINSLGPKYAALATATYQGVASEMNPNGGSGGSYNGPSGFNPKNATNSGGGNGSSGGGGGGGGGPRGPNDDFRIGNINEDWRYYPVTQGPNQSSGSGSPYNL